MKSGTPMVVAAFFAGCSVYTPPGETPSGSGGSDPTGGKDGGGASGASSQAGGTSGMGGEAGSSGAGGGSDTEDAGGVGGSGLADGAPMGSRDAPDSAIGADASDGRIHMDGSTCALSALQFGGFQGYVRVNRPVQDDFTLEAWVAATTPGVMAGTNFWDGSGLLYADAMGVSNDFGTALLGSMFAFGVGNPDTTITSVTDVMTGAWVHVAATRRKSTGEIQVFVNGVMEASRIVAQTNSLNAQANMTIGGNAIDNRYYTGLLDEIRVWNVVRSAAEITSTMHQRLTGGEPGLVGYWRLDDGSGTTAIDSSQTHPDAAGPNDGILFGPINWVASDAPICP
jgi:hypothetical protein